MNARTYGNDGSYDGLEKIGSYARSFIACLRAPIVSMSAPEPVSAQEPRHPSEAHEIVPHANRSRNMRVAQDARKVSSEILHLARRLDVAGERRRAEPAEVWDEQVEVILIKK